MGFNTLFGWLPLALLLVLLQFNVKGQTEKEPTYYVVTNNPAVKSLTFKALEDILYGETLTWKSGERISIAFHNSDNPKLQKTANLFFEGSTLTLKKHWLSLIFQGRADIPPVFLNTDKDIMEFVKTNKGAIAIIYTKPEGSVHQINISP